MSTEIKFVTSEAHEKNAKVETCYQTQLRHNAVLNAKLPLRSCGASGD